MSDGRTGMTASCPSRPVTQARQLFRSPVGYWVRPAPQSATGMWPAPFVGSS